MNKLIKAQLQKVSVANIGEFDDNSKEIFIPKYTQDRYEVGKYYLIMLDDTLLNNYNNPILVSNWNNNTYPKSKYMKVEVIKMMGKMICVNGIGYDINTKSNLCYTWSGWLPTASIKQVDKL